MKEQSTVQRRTDGCSSRWMWWHQTRKFKVAETQTYIRHAQRLSTCSEFQQKVVLHVWSGLPEDRDKFHLPVALWQRVRTTQLRARTFLHY